MLISLDWIKDFVEIDDNIDTKELESLFTLGVAEVEKTEVVGDHLQKIRIAEVLEKEKHPEADKLNLVTFHVGDEKKLKVVCGAPNVKVGMKTAYAPLGVTLPNGLTLEPKKIRGVLSEGMLCSEEELGFSEESEGIIELPADAPLGVTTLEYYKLKKDLIFDIDNKSLTHRPDLWGHFGMAREFALLVDKKLKNPYDDSWLEEAKKKYSDKTSAPVTIKVETSSSCLGYFGISLENIEVGESPEWLKNRLLAVGLRPINNIVDISNYVMCELGHPLHIFDRDLIEGGSIHIKKLDAHENFITLDEKERELIADDTVICDGQKPLVLAGIMGGLNSGVTEKTKNIFIEVANWKAKEVRQTSTRLGLRTDSSSRYEKSLDSMQMLKTLYRTIDLVMELSPNAKVVGELQYDGPVLSYDPIKITISLDKINRILGTQLKKEKVVDILTALEFNVEGSENNLDVIVPSFRATKDIECDADLIEEIGRVIGYDNIEPVGPQLDIRPVELQNRAKLSKDIRDFLVMNGDATEVMTYPMVGEKLLEKCQFEQNSLKLINSLSKDHDQMRTSLVPGMLESAALNGKNFSSFKSFELGRVYMPDDKNFVNERLHLCVSFYNSSQSTYLDLVNTINRLFDYINISSQPILRHPKFKNEVLDEGWVGVHPFEFHNFRVMGKIKGMATTLHPLMARKFKIKGSLSFAIIDLEDFADKSRVAKVKYKPLPKFPGSNFDYTVTVPLSMNAGDVLEKLRKVKIKEIISHAIVDVFEEKDKDQKHITLRTSFLDRNATLSGDFLKSSEATILSELEKSGIGLKQA